MKNSIEKNDKIKKEVKFSHSKKSIFSENKDSKKIENDISQKSLTERTKTSLKSNKVVLSGRENSGFMKNKSMSNGNFLKKQNCNSQITNKKFQDFKTIDEFITKNFVDECKNAPKPIHTRFDQESTMSIKINDFKTQRINKRTNDHKRKFVPEFLTNSVVENILKKKNF